MMTVHVCDDDCGCACVSVCAGVSVSLLMCTHNPQHPINNSTHHLSNPLPPPPTQQMAATDSNLHTLPTTNMMDLLRNMMSERPGGADLALLETMSQQFDQASLNNLMEMDPAAKALFSQLTGQESGLSGSSGDPASQGAGSSK